MTRDQAERLIERLADKTLEFGQRIKFGNTIVRQVGMDKHGNWVYYHNYSAVDTDFVMKADTKRIGGITLGHPIMLTDVLEKPETVLCWEEEERKDRIYDLWCVWYECGATKSLQEILAEAEWHNAPRKAPEGHVTLADMPEQMKGPAKDLFEYLLKLFPERVSTECTHPIASLTNPPKCFDCGVIL